MHTLVSDPPAIEWLGGRAVPKVSPVHRHGVVQGRFWAILTALGKGRGTAATEWRFRLTKTTRKERRTEVVPDVAFMSYDRWRPLTPLQRQKPPFAPDIAIEVRSPRDRDADVQWKIRAYIDNGALLVLDVFPTERRIVAYDCDGVEAFTTGEMFSRTSVPWLHFHVDEAFADLEPDE